MKSSEMKMLERVFGAEIEGRMFQSKSKILNDLRERNLVCPEIRAIGPPPIVTYSGWIPTHLGRITYCEWASEQVETLDRKKK